MDTAALIDTGALRGSLLPLGSREALVMTDPSVVGHSELKRMFRLPRGADWSVRFTLVTANDIVEDKGPGGRGGIVLAATRQRFPDGKQAALVLIADTEGLGMRNEGRAMLESLRHIVTTYRLRIALELGCRERDLKWMALSAGGEFSSFQPGGAGRQCPYIKWRPLKTGKPLRSLHSLEECFPVVGERIARQVNWWLRQSARGKAHTDVREEMVAHVL